MQSKGFPTEKLLERAKFRKAHLLTFGFVRGQQKEVEMINIIPDDLMTECVKFYTYYTLDEWKPNAYDEDW